MADWTQSATLGGAEDEAMGRADRLARWVSNLLNPATLALPLMALGVYLSHEPGAWRYAALFVAVGVLVPMADLLRQLHRGHISDFHLQHRHERMRPFVVGILCSTAGMALMWVLGGPTLLVAMAQATVLLSVILFAITLYWQISVHMATMAAVITFVLLAFGASGLAFVLLVPLVGWARWRLKRHTVPQVVAGTMLGIVVMLFCMAGVLY